MATIRSLSKQIEKEIKISTFDCPPVYHPQIREFRKLANVSLDILIRDLDIMFQEDFIKKLKLKNFKKTIPIFKSALMQVKENLTKHERWSFWHFSILIIITSIHYAEMCKKNKHKTINLNDQKNWNNPNHEVAILSITFVAGTLYEHSLPKLLKLNNQKDMDIKIMIDTLLRNMNKLD